LLLRPLARLDNAWEREQRRAREIGAGDFDVKIAGASARDELSIDRDRYKNYDSTQTMEPYMSESASSCKIVTVANQKGGAGKTTTSLTLAETVQRRGFHVLVLDVDPQASSAKWEARPKAGYARYPVRVERLLMSGEIKTGDDFFWEIHTKARGYEETNKHPLDFIFVDTAPRIDSDELAASLLVSDLVVMPFAATGQHVNAAEETFGLFARVNEMRRQSRRPPLKIRVLRNFWKSNRPLSGSIYAAFQKRVATLPGLDVKFFEGALKNIVAFEDVSSYQTGIFSLPGTTPARKILDGLVDELLEMLQ
jgi:chromosome partitioning protein